MSNREILEKFYTAFQARDGQAMANLYHVEGYFSDPVFQSLTAEEAGAMWKMLLKRADGQLSIDFHSIQETDDSVSCVWEAKYPFSNTGRMVHNVIRTKMTIEDGRILIHEDHFNFWKWSRMALGTPGLLLGWTPIIKKKVRAQAQTSLEKFMSSR